MPTIMDFYNTGLEAAKNRTLAPYIGPTAKADIASKEAYAQYLPAQIAAQVYSNPMLTYMIMKGLIPNPLRQWGIKMLGEGPSTIPSGGLANTTSYNSSPISAPVTSDALQSSTTNQIKNSPSAINDGLAQVDLSGTSSIIGTASSPTATTSPTTASSSSPSGGLMGGGSTGDPVLDAYFGNMFAGLGRDPRFDTGKGGPGATYTNPNTSNKVSIPTSQTAGMNQQTIDAIDRVSPLIKNIAKNLPQFQSFWTRQQAKLGGLGNEYLGANYQLPSIEAQGEADIKNSAEGLIRAWGLRPTNYQTKVMMDSIRPHQGESADGYAQRLVNTLMTLQANQNLAKQNQSEGINLTSQNKVYTWNPKTRSIE